MCVWGVLSAALEAVRRLEGIRIVISPFGHGLPPALACPKPSPSTPPPSPQDGERRARVFNNAVKAAIGKVQRELETERDDLQARGEERGGGEEERGVLWGGGTKRSSAGN